MRRSAGIACHIPLMAALLASACTAAAPGRGALSAAQAASIADSVRAFADSVAHGVTARGPAAWRGYFADTAAFFMASEGQLVFPSSDSATKGIKALEQVIARIELTWGGTVHVDPIAPGLAVMATTYHEVRVDRMGKVVDERGFLTGLVEHRAAGWQFRDAHWSVASPPSAVP
jgi:hypothetical protein